MMQKNGFEVSLLETSKITSRDYELKACLRNTNDEAQKLSSASFFLGLHYGNWYRGITLKPRSPLPLAIGANESIETVLLSGTELPQARDGELIVPTPPSGELDLRDCEDLADLARRGRIELGVSYTYSFSYEVVLQRKIRFLQKRKVGTRSRDVHISASVMLTL